MPVVPKYQGNVQANSIPTDRVPTEAPLSAFGGGEAVSGAYQAAGKLVQDIEQRIDATAIIEADNELTVAKNEILGKVKSFKGKDAPKAQEEAQKLWQEKFEKVNSGLIGRQQAAFAKVASTTWQAVNTSTEDHVNKELGAWQDDTEKNSISLSRKEAINKHSEYQDLAQKASFVSSLISKQNAVIESRMRRLGTPEKAELAMLEASTETHAGVIQDMLSRDEDLSAKSYYEINKNQIDKEAGKQIIANLEAGSTKVKAVDLADKLIGAGKGEAWALKEIQKEYETDKNVDKRFLAESRVKAKYNEDDNKKEISRVAIRTRLTNILDKANFDMTHPDVVQGMLSLDDTGKTAIRAYAAARGFKSNNMVKLDELEDTLYDTDELLKESEIHEAELTPTKKEELLDRNRTKKIGGEKWEKIQGEFSTTKSLIASKVKATGLSTNKKFVGAFEESVKKEFLAFKEITGNNPDPDQKQKIVDNLALKKSMEWYRADRYKFNLKFEDVPQEFVDKAKAKLIQRRLPVSNEVILSMFRNKDG